MTEAQWGALTKMAQYMPPFDTNNLRQIYLTISADGGIVYMYGNMVYRDEDLTIH